ncbi:hypothetical protein [Oceanobacillus senegalensis]|uniref:hypothetical protein n=1 Tax=Oceanobacillus senegalensis TaxID=1936063 RepID=UPI001FE7E00F|nr:hypothetical protein [Oceanobacillus senegalensis]
MEHWERWIPINGLPLKLYNDTFIDNKEGIIVGFSDEKEKLKVVVKFEEGVLSYRNTDEGSLLKRLNDIDQQYGTAFIASGPYLK